GAYQAPDWTADWLHRELEHWLELAAMDTYGVPYAELTAGEQAQLQSGLQTEYRTNTLDPESQVVTISDRRAQAIEQTAQYYVDLYGDEPSMQKTRANFAMKEGTLPSLERRQDLAMFYFWTAWAAGTERPETSVTYTNNWPHEPLIKNTPSAANI